MKVQVEDALPRIRADVGDKAVAALADAQVARNLCRRCEDRCQHWPILSRQVRHRGDVTPRNEQDMLRRLRVDILKRDHILVLIVNLTRYLTCCHLAEQAVLNAHTNTFPPRYSSNHEISRIVPYCATKGGERVFARQSSRCSGCSPLDLLRHGNIAIPMGSLVADRDRFSWPRLIRQRR